MRALRWKIKATLHNVGSYSDSEDRFILLIFYSFYIFFGVVTFQPLYVAGELVSE